MLEPIANDPGSNALNFLSRTYQRYRQWEDGYIEMLDALDAGRPTDPAWTATAYRRKLLERCAQMSATERMQTRDFIWRYRGWRGWAWLAAIACLNCFVGLLVHIAWPEKMGLLESFVIVNLLVLCFGYGVVACWFNPKRIAEVKPRALLLVLLLALLGALVGATVAALVKGEPPLEMLQRRGGVIALAGVLTGAVYAGALTLIVLMRNRELRALNARLAAEAERQRLAGQLAESRLRLLQAQIEPHFLFNTLGAVQQLAERRAPEAAALTAHLVRFLRDSMASFRGEGTTLGAEIDLAQSYFKIMQSRLGARLDYGIDVPEILRAAPIRPTLVITLVENAIKHGIEPSPAGGRITLSARAEGDRLVVEVADTGMGMAELPGSGQGLRNVREQLALAHGDRGGLELFENEPNGLVARLSLPLETSA